jgi:hypothetical protein
MTTESRWSGVIVGQQECNMQDEDMRAMAGPGLNVRRFGAKGDDATDDTAAIQRAIDAAGEVQGAVWFPPGQYRCGMLQVRTHVALTGQPTWAYRRHGGTVLRLNDPRARCLVNISRTVGARVSGLALDGGHLGTEVHGIYKDGEELGTENSLVIENCRVAEFSGDGARLEHAWGFTVRDCLFHHNGGDGLMTSYWDGWVHDNIMIGNGKFGYAARDANASVTVTANRIEWNAHGGILLEKGANHYNVTGNFIDRSGGPGIVLRGVANPTDPRWLPGTTAITGNIFNRSGARAAPGTRESCHLWIENAAGIACTGNTMCFGNNDDGTGAISPCYAMVLRGLRNSVIVGNALHNAATQHLILDDGGHDTATVIRDNPGCLAPSTLP